MVATLKERAEKLPLTVRKNLRDEWESKKDGFESEISKLTGENWTIEADANQIYPYVDDSYSPRLGSTITWYIEPFIFNLGSFIEKFGDDGKNELNQLCPNHKLVFGPQTTTEFSYGGLVVQDNSLHLVFAEGAYPVNVDDVSKDFGKALADAAKSSPSSNAYNITARNSVKQDYDSEIGEIHNAIKKLLNMPDIKLNPNFEAVSAELIQSSKDNWQERLGFLTRSYFDGFKYCLERNEFGDDDMLQEGFADVIDKKEVCLRVFQKWDDGKSRYNRCVADGGVLYLETIVENFGSNVDDVALNITDIL